MIDLSNNNAVGHNFKRAHDLGGQLRAYLKRCEHTTFIDVTYPRLRTSAIKAHMKAGAYDFLHPLEASPREEAEFFLNLIKLPLQPLVDLRPCLDVEHGAASAAVGRWVTEVAKLVQKETGPQPLIYGNGYFLEACRFVRAPGPLWLAAFGKDDGREYPVGRIPRPWRQFAAHQYTSNGHCIGINGACDLSHVFRPADIDVPKKKGGRGV